MKFFLRLADLYSLDTKIKCFVVMFLSQSYDFCIRLSCDMKTYIIKISQKSSDTKKKSVIIQGDFFAGPPPKSSKNKKCI